ncbi:MAG: hypothetical protein V1900_01530 [Candidatus Aenigmatarchaeota archaeon]
MPKRILVCAGPQHGLPAEFYAAKIMESLAVAGYVPNNGYEIFHKPTGDDVVKTVIEPREPYGFMFLQDGIPPSNRKEGHHFSVHEVIKAVKEHYPKMPFCTFNYNCNGNEKHWMPCLSDVHVAGYPGKGISVKDFYDDTTRTFLLVGLMRDVFKEIPNIRLRKLDEDFRNIPGDQTVGDFEQKFAEAYAQMAWEMGRA